MSDPAINETDELTRRKHGLIAATLTGVFAFFVYLNTMTPGMHPGDGLELATAAAVLGIAHPTGYPVYTVLLHAFMSVLSFIQPIAVSTMVGALCIAMGSALSCRVVYDFACRVGGNGNGAWYALTASGASLCFAFAPACWSAATLTEVYAFQWLLTVGFVRALQSVLTRWHRDGEVGVGALCTAALLCGVGLAHHRMSLFMILPLLLAVGVVLWRVPGKRRAVFLCTVVFCAQLPLWSYLYLPIRSAQKPAMNWGQPNNAQRFLEHVQGGDYLNQRFLMASPGHAFTAESYAQFAQLQTMQIVGDVADQLPLPGAGQIPRQTVAPRGFDRGFAIPANATFVTLLFVLLLIGVAVCTVKMLRRIDTDQRVFLLLVALLGVQNLALLYLYNIADISDYELTPLWTVWLLLMANLYFFGARLQANRAAAVAVPAAVLLLVAAQYGTHRGLCDRSNDREMEDYSYMMMPDETDVLPSDAILLTSGDQDIFPAWYRQYGRGERTDVLVFGSNFIHRPWYASYFTDAQKEKYNLKFFNTIPRGADNFAQMLFEGVLDRNVGKYTIVTTLNDPAVLEILAKRYKLTKTTFCPVLTLIEPKDAQ